MHAMSFCFSPVSPLPVSAFASPSPDGRSLNAVRPTHIAPDSIPSCPGSALVKIGNTSVVCGLKLEIGKPFDTKPQDGRLAVEVHLGPLCSPKFKVGRATEQAVALSQWLTNAVVKSGEGICKRATESGITPWQEMLGARSHLICVSHLSSPLSSGMLHLPDLSIVSGESMWVIYADLVCLNYDGNLADACLLALAQSLRRLRLPETEVVEDGVGERAKRASEICISSVNSQPMTVHRTLIGTTFGVIEGQIIVDPTAAEEGTKTRDTNARASNSARSDADLFLSVLPSSSRSLSQTSSAPR